MGSKPHDTLRRARLAGVLSAEGVTLQSLILSTDPTNLIAYWPLGDKSGTVADDPVGGFDGAYAGTVTLAQAGIGDGSLSALFGGGRVSLAAVVAGLNTPFDPALGTLMIACKVVNAAAWTDGAQRFAAVIGADGNNEVALEKGGGANEIDLVYVAAGTFEFFAYSPVSTLNWFLQTITWNVASDRVLIYLNRANIGSSSTLGTWSGALSQNATAIGSSASSGNFSVWAGWLAHCALWKSELQLADIQNLARVAWFPD